MGRRDDGGTRSAQAPAGLGWAGLGWGAYAIEGALGLHSKPMQLRISVDGDPEQRLAGRIRTTAGIITRTGRDTDPSRIRFRGTEVRIATGHVRKRQIDGDLVTPGSGLLVRVRPGGLVVRVPQ